MRKFTKSLLTLALLVLAVGGAKAEKVYADLSKYDDKWDGTDVSFSWTATYGNQLGPTLDAIGLPKGDLRSWQKLVVVVDELTNCDFFRVLVYSGDDTNHSNTFKCNKTGANEFTLSGNVDFLNNVTKICLSGSNWEDSKNSTWGETPASFKVKEVYLERPDIVYIEASEIFEAPAGTIDIKNLTGTNTGWAGSVTYPKELAVQGQAFGNGDGSSESTHVNIDGYDYICFNVTTATASTAGLRVWIWDGEAGGAGSVKTLYTKPIADYATADYTSYEKITGVGTYVVKVSGYKYLKGVKAENDWGASAAKVSMAYMCIGNPVAYTSTGKYALVGEATGSATLSDALADANATCYDATGVTGTGVDLTSAANPNALFIAGDGVLANTKNVIVSDVCANLELVDGKPFKAPAAFTAINAKFTKTISKAGYGTMVIPFNAALATGIDAAYNLTGVSGSTITTSEAATVAANKPVLLEAAAGEYEFTATSASIAATEESSSNGLLNGTYVGTKAAADADNYVLQNGDAGLGFFLVTGTDADVKPFRAYLNTDVSAPEFLAIEGLGITGIETVKATESKGEFFNLAGQRVAQPAKGLYIVNGKKVIVK